MNIFNPLDHGAQAAYQAWRARKLAGYDSAIQDLVVEINDPHCLTESEIEAMLARLRSTNMVVYACTGGDWVSKDVPRAIGKQFGLSRLDPNMLADDDGVTSLQVVPGKLKRGYIPYSDRRLLWHTDGYYNPPSRYIRAMLLHCVRPAAEGGVNALLDHEMAYLLLRDRDPAYVEALMAEDAMTIPANEEADGTSRQAQTGPVFSLDPASGSLHMRYTARTRSIEWKDDGRTREAVGALEQILAADLPCIVHHRLEPGQGLLCNNVLHNRTSFIDDHGAGKGRLIYRARYYDRIAGTGMDAAQETTAGVEDALPE